jgi:hypothetical protein
VKVPARLVVPSSDAVVFFLFLASLRAVLPNMLF